jgi:hypothetical protein
VIATALLALLASAAPIEERVITVDGPWRETKDASGRTWFTRTLDLSDAPFVRLLAPEGIRVNWNDIPVTPNGEGDYDVPSMRRSNTIALSAPAPVTVKITPRVYLARQKITVADGKLLARIVIRNTLENTVNAFLTVRRDATGQEWTTTATVPPGVAQLVEVSGPCPNASLPMDLTILMEKQEEAMEAGYRVQQKITVKADH